MNLILHKMLLKASLLHHQIFLAMCASCQCYIMNDVELPEISDDEEAMLSEAFYVKLNSRLGCQINITADLDGLALELAPE